MDYLIFSLMVLAGFAALHFWLRRSGRLLRVPLWAWLAVLGLIAVGWFFVQAAGQGAAQQIRQMLEGFPPTYAQEAELLGHAGITPDTSADDPAYLAIVAAELRWKRVNPSIADVYTLRKLPDGRNAFIVASETDYDRNGKFEGEREERVAIGEIYAEEDEGLERAFLGEANFADTPITDRWGTWISAFVPLHDAQGKVEAVLGVDYPAAGWVQAVAQARLTAMSELCVLAILLGSASAVIALLQADLRNRKQTEERVLLLNTQLEQRVLARTAELARTNEALQTEIAEHKRAELALRTSEEHLRLAARVAELGIFDHDLVTGKIYASPLLQTIHGMSYEEADPFTALVERILPEDRPGYIAALERSRDPAGDGRLNNEHRLKQPDGSVYWMHTRSQTWFEGDGAARRGIRAVGVAADITERKRAQLELERAQVDLLAVSRRAALAEFATGILHNVGNVLNSVNVASSCLADSLRRSKSGNLGKLVALLREHEKDLGEFLTQDPKGRQVPVYLAHLAEHLAGEQTGALKELAELQKNIEHIKEIVVMQQGMAKKAGRTEILKVSDLVEDALSMNASALAQHEIQVVKEFEEMPLLILEKNKALQILVNLVRNATQACATSGRPEKKLTVRTAAGNGRVQIAVSDNGVGIPPENLARIFTHGFTTKQEGHGFGLNSCALAAKELGGSLTVQSVGHGHGATFTLELPGQSPPANDEHPIP